MVQKAKEAADQAISVGPDQFEGYAARAAYRSNFDWDWAGARANLQRALELNPGDDRPHYRFASLLLKLGLFQEALNACSRTVEINPLSDEGWRTKGYILIAMHRLADAEIPIRRSLEIQPANPRNREFLAELLLLQADRLTR